MYWTFELPSDRGPAAWARYGTETIQIGPFETEAEAWDSLRASYGEDRANLAKLARID
jgi:hypothetical protein